MKKKDFFKFFRENIYGFSSVDLDAGSDIDINDTRNSFSKKYNKNWQHRFNDLIRRTMITPNAKYKHRNSIRTHDSDELIANTNIRKKYSEFIHEQFKIDIEKIFYNGEKPVYDDNYCQLLYAIGLKVISPLLFQNYEDNKDVEVDEAKYKIYYIIKRFNPDIIPDYQIFEYEIRYRFETKYGYLYKKITILNWNDPQELKILSVAMDLAESMAKDEKLLDDKMNELIKEIETDYEYINSVCEYDEIEYKEPLYGIVDRFGMNAQYYKWLKIPENDMMCYLLTLIKLLEHMSNKCYDMMNEVTLCGILLIYNVINETNEPYISTIISNYNVSYKKDAEDTSEAENKSETDRQSRKEYFDDMLYEMYGYKSDTIGWVYGEDSLNTTNRSFF